MSKNFRIGIIIVISLILIYNITSIIFKAKKASHSNIEAMENILPSIDTLTSEDSDLISPQYIEKVKIDDVWQNKIRHPLSLLSFDNKYNLIIHKIELTQEISFYKCFDIETVKNDKTYGVSYRISGNNDYYKLGYAGFKISPVSKIFIQMWGDSIQLMRNTDTILSYYLLCKNLSIKYTKKDSVDFYLNRNFKAWSSSKLIPLNLLFIKRMKWLYMVLMFPNKMTYGISKEYLYNILNKSNADEK